MASHASSGAFEHPLYRPAETVQVRSTASPSYQAYQILHFAFFAAPFIAGVDKFMNLLTDWGQYLSPTAMDMLGSMKVSTETFMMGVGVVEILAAFLVALMPAVGGWVVAAWLAGIIINLLMVPGYFDVALRDFGLMLGAIAFARLAMDFGKK